MGRELGRLRFNSDSGSFVSCLSTLGQKIGQKINDATDTAFTAPNGQHYTMVFAVITMKTSNSIWLNYIQLLFYSNRFIVHYSYFVHIGVHLYPVDICIAFVPLASSSKVITAPKIHLAYLTTYHEEPVRTFHPQYVTELALVCLYTVVSYDSAEKKYVIICQKWLTMSSFRDWCCEIQMFVPALSKRGTLSFVFHTCCICIVSACPWQRPKLV